MFTFLVFIALVVEGSSATFDQAEENRTLAFLDYYNRVVVQGRYKSNEASWNYATNLTETNKKIKTKINVQFSLFMQKARLNASEFDVNKLSEDTKRQIEMLKSSSSPKAEDDITKLNELGSKMSSIYSGGTVIDTDGKTKLQLDPELTQILRTNRNYDRLLFAWKGWRDATGPKLRPIYKKFVELSNKGAKENGWDDKGAYWRSLYEVADLESDVEALYNDLKPLYQELHAYVRFKLTKKYPGKVGKSDPIPAHLFGNMWAQSWINIYDLIEPYQGQPSLDVTQNLVKQNYNPKKMVELANSFFVSIGLLQLPQSLYEKSMLEKPDGREVVCHPSAWDFAINYDVRVKQCTTVTHDYLVTTHHELGHIQYFLQYWNLPYEYRAGANPGFHEAVGDTLSLSVNTPQHLKTIGLLKNISTTKESDINALMKSALSKVAFLPFGYLIDQWRWNVFRGKITPENYNSEWWKLRTKYQGIRPPVERTEKDFDPGAKYHIPGNTPYIRYFVSTIVQFQFHKAACDAAGFKGPLHQCSIYNSKAAGKKLGDMLAMGKSKPWPDALEKMTGTRKMDVGPLKEYFQPLKTWLEEQRKQYKYPIGWDSKPSSTGSGVLASVFLTPVALFVSLLIY